MVGSKPLRVSSKVKPKSLPRLWLLIFIGQSFLVISESKVSRGQSQANKATASSITPTHCGRNRYHLSPRGARGSFYSKPTYLVKRIVGGQASESGEWPWLVTLQLARNGTYREHACGGTLIHPQWIVTAAHCFEDLWIHYLTDDPTAWRVRLGEHNMFSDDPSEVDVDVEKIILHPNRKPPKTFNFDIALMKLVRPVQLNSQVNVVCLPSREDRYPSGTGCVTAGWGHSTEDGFISNVVQHVQVPIISKHTCNFLYQKISSKIRIHISNDMLCAGLQQGGRDACQYDSGGPMVYFNPAESRWILVGVVSTGYGCARPGFPGIYTRVSEYVAWIQNVIANN